MLLPVQCSWRVNDLGCVTTKAHTDDIIINETKVLTNDFKP